MSRISDDLQRFATERDRGCRWVVDSGEDSLTLRPVSWGERLVRLLVTIVTCGRCDGFAAMRWTAVAGKIQQKATEVMRELQASGRPKEMKGLFDLLRVRLQDCAARYKASHPQWKETAGAPELLALEQWILQGPDLAH